MTDISSGMRNFPHNLPVGWRFDPSDEELVGYYLKRKRRGDRVHSSDIGEVDVYNFNPWDLPGDPSKNSSGDKVWYFFYIREYCRDGKQSKRKAGNGSWRITGVTLSVTAEESGEEIGTRRTLVFYNPGKTDWVMYEYECIAPPNSPIKDNYVLCKIRINPDKKKRAVKRSREAESGCKTPKAKKKAKKGESNCNMALASTSASEKKKNSMEIVPSSTNYKGELCIEKHAISGLGNQNSDKMTAAASYEKGESSNPYAHSQGEINSFSICNKDETSSFIASSFNNQNIDQMTDVSTSNIGMTFNDCGNRSQSEIISISTLEKRETCNLGTHSCKNQNTMQMTDVSTSNEGEVSYMVSYLGNCDDMSSYKSSETRWPVVSDLENCSPDQMTIMSSCKKGKPSCSTAIGLLNHNSYETATVSSNNKGATSCHMNFDYENQNSNEMAFESFSHMNFHVENQISIKMAEKSFPDNTELSACTIGVWNYDLETPYVADNQNIYEKTNGVSLMKEYKNSSTVSSVEETTSQEVQNQYKGVETPVKHRSPSVISNFQEARLQEKQTNQYNTMDMPRSCSNFGEATLPEVQTPQSDPADMLIVEDNNLQMTSHGGEAAFPEISPELVEEILAYYELKDCLNATPEQPIHSNELPSSSSLFTPASI